MRLLHIVEDHAESPFGLLVVMLTQKAGDSSAGVHMRRKVAHDVRVPLRHLMLEVPDRIARARTARMT